MTINKSIRKIRENKNLTQEEMAEKLNMSPSGYGKIERGDIQLKFDKLERIANIFEIDVVELLMMDKDEGMVIQFLNSSGDNATANYYSSHDDSLMIEIEKLKLTVQHHSQTINLKDIIIEQKNQEIQCLKEIIGLLKSK